MSLSSSCLMKMESCSPLSDDSLMLNLDLFDELSDLEPPAPHHQQQLRHSLVKDELLADLTADSPMSDIDTLLNELAPGGYCTTGAIGSCGPTGASCHSPSVCDSERALESEDAGFVSGGGSSSGTEEEEGGSGGSSCSELVSHSDSEELSGGECDRFMDHTQSIDVTDNWSLSSSSPSSCSSLSLSPASSPASVSAAAAAAPPDEHHHSSLSTTPSPSPPAAVAVAGGADTAAVSTSTASTTNSGGVMCSVAKPLVVPVSVRGAGNVCTVRILPATPAPHTAKIASTGIASVGDNGGASVAKASANVRGVFSGSPRVIRVVRQQKTTGGAAAGAASLSLPVITLSRHASSAPAGVAARFQWRRAPEPLSGSDGAGAVRVITAPHPPPAATKAARVILSVEERRLLEQEGLEVPTRYPLTRQQEYDLKRIRRKIRNKMSAQDSRKRKKEYYDSLEDRVRVCSEENRSLHTRLRALESRHDTLVAENATLAAQLRRATASAAAAAAAPSNLPPPPTTTTTSVGARARRAVPPAAVCLLLLLLSVSLCLLPTQRTNQQQQLQQLDQLQQQYDSVSGGGVAAGGLASGGSSLGRRCSAAANTSSSSSHLAVQSPLAASHSLTAAWQQLLAHSLSAPPRPSATPTSADHHRHATASATGGAKRARLTASPSRQPPLDQWGAGTVVTSCHEPLGNGPVERAMSPVQLD